MRTLALALVALMVVGALPTALATVAESSSTVAVACPSSAVDRLVCKAGEAYCGTGACAVTLRLFCMARELLTDEPLPWICH